MTDTKRPAPAGTMARAIQDIELLAARLHKAEHTLQVEGYIDRGGELWEKPAYKGPGFIRQGLMIPVDHPDYPPTEISDAARKVGAWAARHAGPGWQLGPCADRFYYCTKGK